MFTERGLGVLIVTLISVIAVKSECKYKAVVTKAAPCPSNKDPVVVLENFDMALSDNECGLVIKGCVVFKKDVKQLEVKYKGFKDGLPVLSGSKVACGYKEKGFEVKCPLKKGAKICPGKDAAVEMPGGQKTAAMAKGNLKASIELIADGKKYCYEGTGTISNK